LKVLMAISSCGDFETNGNNQAMRDTWLKDVGVFANLDYKFFFGEGQNAPQLEDSVLLPGVPDGYGHLTYKTQASLRWAHERGYDFVWRVFPDTYVRVDRLMASGFEAHDYHGDFRSEGDAEAGKGTEAVGPILQRAQNYASGGAGYSLSRRAFGMLLRAPITGIWRDEITPYAEDLWVGNRLGLSGFALKYFDDKRFCNHGSSHWPSPKNQLVTSHMSCPDRYDKAMMYAAHEVWSTEKTGER
jgi:hypothetical protein